MAFAITTENGTSDNALSPYVTSYRSSYAIRPVMYKYDFSYGNKN